MKMTLDLDLPIEAVKEIAQGGDNAKAVSFWCKKLSLYLRVSRKAAYDAVKELGTYADKDLQRMTDKEIIEFAVWDLAWYLSESE